MGSALVGGLLRAGRGADTMVIVEVDESRRDALAASLPGVATSARVVAADAAVVAVKPAQGEEACRALADAAGGAPDRVLSIMAGVPLAQLSRWLTSPVAVIRAMPNTPALIGAGMAAISAGASAGEADMAWAEEILGAVGEVVRVPEAALDAVTAVSGSGPAYIFLVAEALIAAGVAAGLDPATSRRLALATIAGSARLLVETGDDPAALRAQVTSPGGTTEAALAVLEDHGLRRAFAEAVAAAARRSEELGR